MKLHPINHDLKTTLWCGPAALSAVTGAPTSVIHRVIQEVRQNQAPVKGVSNSTLKRAAEKLGYKLEPVLDYIEIWRGQPAGALFRPPTLAKFIREHRAPISEAPVIVHVTGHYVVLFRRTFVDNQTSPVPLRRAPHRRVRVKHAWKVVPLREQGVE